MTTATASGTARSSWMPFAVVAGLLSGLWAYKMLLHPRPFWAAETDLEMDFFFRSLRFAAGHPAFMTLHPGTPVELLGALIITVFRTQPQDIQRFLAIGYWVGLAATLVALGVTAKGPSRALPVWLGTAVLAAPFVNDASLIYLGYWGSEMLLVPGGLIAWWALWRASLGRTPLHPRAVATAGVLCGLLCAIKIIYIPLVVAATVGFALAGAAAVAYQQPVRQARVTGSLFAVWGICTLAWLGVLLRTSFWRHHALQAGLLWGGWLGNTLLLAGTVAVWVGTRRADQWKAGRSALAGVRVAWEFLAGSAGGWLLGTWSIVPFYGDVLQQMTNGLFGSVVDPSARVSLGNVAREGARLVASAPVWSSLCVLVGLSLITQLARGLGYGWRGSRRPPAGSLGLGVMLVTSLGWGLLAAARSHAAVELDYRAGVLGIELRWLMPAAVAVAVGLAWIGHGALVEAPVRWRGGMAVCVAASGLVALGFVQAVVRDTVQHRRTIAVGRAEQAGLQTHLAVLREQLGREPVVLVPPYHVGLRWPSVALRIGDRYERRAFKDDIDRLFPQEGVFDYRARRILLPEGHATFDVLLMHEADLPREARARQEFLGYLGTLGRLERWSDGLPDSVIAVRTPR